MEVNLAWFGLGLNNIAKASSIDRRVLGRLGMAGWSPLSAKYNVVRGRFLWKHF
jgi:hypothetical protein